MVTETEEEKKKREEEAEKKAEEEAEKKADEEAKKKADKKKGLKIDKAAQVSRKDFDALGERVGVLESFSKLAEDLLGVKPPKPKPNGDPPANPPVILPVKVPFMRRKFGSVGTLIDAFWDGDK